MNAARGEVALQIDGRPRRLCLTLGALAEIMGALDCNSVSTLTERLARMNGADVRLVLGALLRGGGEQDIAGRMTGSDDLLSCIDWREATRAVAKAFEVALVVG